MGPALKRRLALLAWLSLVALGVALWNWLAQSPFSIARGTEAAALRGPLALLALFGVGVWIGRQLIKPSDDQSAVSWREVWRFGPSQKYQQNPKIFFVFAIAFGVLIASFGMRMFADSIDSFVLAVLTTGAGAASIGVGWGALVFGGWIKSK